VTHAVVVALFTSVLALACGSSNSAAVPADAALPWPDATATSPDALSTTDVAAPTSDAPGDARSVAADDVAADPKGTYSAVEVFGANRIVTVVKRTETFCVFLYLWDARDGSPKGLVLPPGWGVSELRAMQPPEACDPRYLGGVDQEYDASSQAGTITFAPGLPWTLQNVSVDLTFTNPPLWCPEHVSFRAANIPVQRLP
jgi:hypothetical protein